MRKPATSLSTRTDEFTPCELPLRAPADPPKPPPLQERPAAGRIKDALLRWLEEEL